MKRFLISVCTLFIIVSFASWTSWACGDKKSETTETAVQQPGAEIGEVTVCPIMGNSFTITEDSPSTEYKGEVVYFCCPGCIEKFQEDPEGALSKK